MRYRPEIQWSGSSWTHNVFRCYELIFGRKFGIRPEMSARYSEGVITYTCHSWESAFALTEQYVRLFFKGIVFAPKRVWIPLLQTPQGFTFPSSPFLFAIAFDTSVIGGAGSATWSHTCTGSNIGLFIGMVTTSGLASAATYNSVSASLTDSIASTNGCTGQTLFFLANASTGSNTVSVTVGAGVFQGYSCSYSGVSAIDSHAANTVGTNQSSWPSSTTVVAANCWLIAMGSGSGNFTGVTVAVGTVRQFNAGDDGIADSNGTVGTGSQNITFQRASAQNWSSVIASFSPAGGAAATPAFLAILGIGS